MKNLANEWDVATAAALEEEASSVAGKIQPRRAPFVLVTAQAILDVVMAGLAFVAAYYLRLNTDIGGVFVAQSRATYFTIIVILTITLLVVFAVNRLYSLKPGTSRMDEFYKILAGVSEASILAIAVGSFIMADQFVYSRQVLLTYWALAVVGITFARALFGISVGGLRKRGVAQQRILIVGAGTTGQMVLDKIQSTPSLGYRVIGFVDDLAAGMVEGVPVRGTTGELGNLLERHRVDEVVIALSGWSHQDILEIISHCEDKAVSIKVCPDAFQIITNNTMGISALGGMPLISVRDMTLQGWKRALKRTVDLVISSLMLITLSPVMMVVALLIKISSPGHVFYVQERVGLDGKPIHILKFRSMRIDAEEKTGPIWARKDDPRKTLIGRFIRRFSIDEFPQFINVLLGEMSIVGPRPERPHFVHQFSQTIPSYMRRHREKTGLTGWAQVNGLRGDSSIEERTRYDLYYIENWSLWFDFKIMAMTLLEVFRGRNAY